MFLGIEFASWVGAAVGVLVLILFFSYLSERAARRDEEHSRAFWCARTGEAIDRLEVARNDLKNATRRGDFWKKDYETLHTSFVQVDSDLQTARTQEEASLGLSKTALKAVDFLAEKVTELVDEVGEREEDVEDLEDALEETEEELDIADDLLDRADELLHASTDLFLEQEQELERARTLSHSATALALRLARKMDRLGVEATDEGIAGWSGAVEHQ